MQSAGPQKLMLLGWALLQIRGGPFATDIKAPVI